MTAKGPNVYVKKNYGSLYNSTKFAICVKCHDSHDSDFDSIEVCLSNDDELMPKFDDSRKDNCDVKSNVTNYFKISKSCQSTSETVCGLILNASNKQLGLALVDSVAIECSNLSKPKNESDLGPHEIDLKCPKNSTAIGLEKFGMQFSVIALLCKPNNEPLNRYFIYINVFGKDDGKREIPFDNNSDCPIESQVIVGKKRCTLEENENKFCGLRWKKPGKNNSKIEFTMCANDHAETVASVASLVGINVFIILAVIIVIIALGI